MQQLMGFLTLILVTSSQAVKAQELKLCYGSTSHNSIFKKLIPEFKQKTGITITPVSPLESGAVDHIRDLIQGKCEGAIGNADREHLMKLVRQTGIQVEDSKVTHRVVGREFLKIITHKDVTKSSFTFAELKGLFTGKTTNWKELQGSNQEIKIVFAKNKKSTAEFFAKQVLGGESLTEKAVGLPDYPDVVDYVAKTPGAVSFIAHSIDAKDTRTVKTEDEIGRPKTLVTMGKPSENMMKLINELVKLK